MFMRFFHSWRSVRYFPRFIFFSRICSAWSSPSFESLRVFLMRWLKSRFVFAAFQSWNFDGSKGDIDGKWHLPRIVDQLLASGSDLKCHKVHARRKTGGLSSELLIPYPRTVSRVYICIWVAPWIPHPDHKFTISRNVPALSLFSGRRKSLSWGDTVLSFCEYTHFEIQLGLHLAEC